VYDGLRGEIRLLNVDGVRDVGTLREANPEVADRIDRLWEYDQSSYKQQLAKWLSISLKRFTHRLPNREGGRSQFL
jgi:hypothetical protein